MLLTSIKEKGPLGKKSPFTRKDSNPFRKRAGSEDQKGCEQTIRRTSLLVWRWGKCWSDCLVCTSL